MLIPEIEQLIIDQHLYTLPYPVNDVNTKGSYIDIDDKVCFTVEYVASEYPRNNDILIFNETNLNIGVLLFLKGKEMDISLLSEYQFVALLNEIPDAKPLQTGIYTFSHDYVVIDIQYFDEYNDKYKNTAPIWGKFNHPYPGIGISFININLTPQLKAESLDGFNNDYYFETSIRGLSQSSPFERFLKFYHLIELNFDYDVIKRIKKFNIQTDPLMMGKLLKEYDRAESKRLLYLFDNYVTNLTPIVVRLNTIASYVNVAKSFLFDFGKDENPFKGNYTTYQKFEQNVSGFSFTNFQSFYGSKANAEQYSDMIAKFVVYIIYRVRCSIAHNKLGEFVMTENEKDFVHNFAEPLLFEVLKQVFKI